MATFQRVALSFLLFASMMMMISSSDAANDDHVSYEEVLYTNVPYYMKPMTKTNGSKWGGFAPQRIENERPCPSAVVLTPEDDMGIPIIFTVPNRATIRINDYPFTYFFISFVITNTSALRCDVSTTWGREQFSQLQEDTWTSHLVELIPPRFLFDSSTFRVLKTGNGFEVSALIVKEGSPVASRFWPRYDSENGVTRLALEVFKPTYFEYFSFVEASNYEGIKPVV